MPCEYCGFINNADPSRPVPQIGVLPVNPSVDVFKSAEDYVASHPLITRGAVRRADMAVTGTYYMPVWNFSVRLTGQLSGERALFRADTTGKKVASAVLTGVLTSVLSSQTKGAVGRDAFRERTRVNELIEAPVVARRAAEFRIEPGRYRIATAMKEPYRGGLESMLAVELDAEEAAEIAKDEALDELRSRYSVLHEFNVTAEVVGEPELFYVPVAIVRYSFGQREYMAVVDRSSGRVLAGHRPLAKFGFTVRGRGET